MTKVQLRKPNEEQGGTVRTVPSHWLCALWAFICAADPERKRYRKSDINYVKWHAKTLASAIAARGAKWLDEPVTLRDDHVDLVDERPEFASDLGSTDEWQDAARCISCLSSKLVELMHSTGKGTPFLPDMFEALGILAYVQARIAQVLETAG